MASNCEEETPSLPQPHEWNSMAANLLKSRPLQYLSQPNFNGAALKKISDNHKLAEIALIDPKRVKRYYSYRIQIPPTQGNLLFIKYLHFVNEILVEFWPTVSQLLVPRRERCDT